MSLNKEEAAPVALDDDELRYKISADGCRPCCSFPHGKYTLLTAIFATVAWMLGMAAVNNCHFLLPQQHLYCHPPPEQPPKYGTCGDCHCINGDKPCPSNPDEIPLVDVPDDWLKQLQNMDAINPHLMTCNPYNTTSGWTGNCTNPPQEEYQLELWETAACGITYDMDTLDEDQCPTQYTLATYDSKEEMLTAGAVMTHWGACGACSSTKDLAVYLKHPDLTGKGQECGVRGLIDFWDGVRCFQEVDYTPECAEMWMYNVLNTRDACFEICVDFTFFGDGANNGPPPQCKLANCLLCDERMSGPIFQTVAARSRRRSGLLSRIVRDCENLLIVDHEPPCNLTRRMLAKQSGNRYLQGKSSNVRITPPPRFVEPEPTDTCVFIDTYLGLGGYAGTQKNGWSWLLGSIAADNEYTSLYNTCFRYDFKNVLSGFWANQREILGSAYQAAVTFSFLSNLIGGITLVFVWCSICVAFGERVWKIIAILFAMCGLFLLLTLLFLASDVCDEGCTIGKAAVCAIIGVFVWMAAVISAWTTKHYDESIPKATCCCCPTPIVDGQPAVYHVVPGEETDDAVTTEIVVIETKQEDGSVVIEQVTTYPNGKKAIERTIRRQQ